MGPPICQRRQSERERPRLSDPRGNYPHQRRLKLIGHARQADDLETLARLEDAAYAARVERGIVIAPRIARKSGRRFFDKAMRP